MSLWVPNNYWVVLANIYETISSPHVRPFRPEFTFSLNTALERVCVLEGHLAALSGDDTDVSGDPVSGLHLHQVSYHQVVSNNLHLLPFTDYQGLLAVEEFANNERDPHLR